MRQTREAKAATHDVIVTRAARLFRARGIEGTSVADVMQAAERTHGGFYRHFDTKDALLQSVLKSAFTDMCSLMQAGFADSDAANALDGFLAHYLSPDRVANVADGCPIAALAGDIARSSDTLKTEFGEGVREAISTLADALDGPVETRMQRATRAFAMAAGAVMIARASDPETGELVLTEARRGPEAADVPSRA
jgi:TetR/AcrR family transcriptional repressor of nem operon